MKLTEFLTDGKPHLSFEVFPPKTDTGFESVRGAALRIAEEKPSFISVTYGAGGGTSRYTIDLAKEVQQHSGVPTVAHLTCVSSDRKTVAQRIDEISAAGVDNVMALRGDIPADLLDADRSGWDYHHAIELVRQLKESGHDFCIGTACYPEVHPESANSSEDIRHLKEKVEAGADYLVTQMFFDNDLLFNFLYKLRSAGITVPVIPGIMPITNAKQVEKALQLSGSFMPMRFKRLVDRFGGDNDAMMQAGIIYATDQIIDLYANGITNVHVYTMNKPHVAAGIMANLSAILKK